MKHAKFLKNVAVISAGGLIAKAIGAFYRIPLMGFLGGYQMGLYQMAYPLFCLLLTFSSAGIPSAFSRIVAAETVRGQRGRTTLNKALLLFACAGGAGAVLMCVLAPVMSSMQGDGNLLNCYFALAPSVFLVAVIAVLRGFFQGRNDMTPTALSEIVEQLVKCALGLYFAGKYQGDTRAVVYTLWAVTFSEVAALAFLFVRLRAEKPTCRPLLSANKASAAGILASVLPVMIAAAILPLSQTVDSVLLVRLLPFERGRSVSLYGLLTGGALSLVNLPATACYGLAAATVPAVSARVARGDEKGARKSALYALTVTLALSACCAIGLFALARPIVKLLYGSLSAEDSETLVGLIRLVAGSAVTLSGVETLTACLTGMGRAKKAACSMALAVLCKTLLQVLLVPRFSLVGAVIAANACYMIAFSLDLFYTVRKNKRGRNDNDHRIGRAKRRLDGAGENCAQGSGQSAREKFVARLGRFKRRRDNV